MRIAGVVRMLMAAAQEDQGDLARVLHKDQTTVSRMLNGTRKMTVDELDAIAQHFDVSVGTLFAGPEALRQNWKIRDPERLSLVAGGSGGDGRPRRTGHLRAVR